MKFFPIVRRTLLARALLPLMVGGMALSLASCGGADGDAPSSKSSAITKDSGSGVTIKSDGLAIDANTATAILRGYSSQPLSVRIMSGWIDREKAKQAGQETDEAEQRKQAMASFGTVKVQVAAGKAEPGRYQLAPDSDSPETGTVIIDKAKTAGIASDYTSQSGTLTIKSVTMKGDDVVATVAAIEGSYNGTFSSDDGDSREFSGEFRFVPKDK